MTTIIRNPIKKNGYNIHSEEHHTRRKMELIQSKPTASIIRTGEGGFITVVMGGETLTLRASDSADNFERALQAFKDEDWETLYVAMRPVKFYATKINGVTVSEDGVTWNGLPIHNVVAKRILEFAQQGLPVNPLCAFMDKLMANPSKRAVEELYTFLEHKNLPITDNGNFLAYKGIKSDWNSCTAGTVQLLKGRANGHGQIYNGVGEVIEVPRNQVCDDKEIGCSYGLHAGTLSYATGFAQGKVVQVEINPADVVSIPTDCNYEKLRTCKYKVVAEYDCPLDKPLYESRFNDHDYDGQREHFISFTCNNSSWIDSVEWNDDDWTLTIYKSDGDSLEYGDVPFDVAEEFETHVGENYSAGQFYNQNIKDEYDLI